MNIPIIQTLSSSASVRSRSVQHTQLAASFSHENDTTMSDSRSMANNNKFNSLFTTTAAAASNAYPKTLHRSIQNILLASFLNLLGYTILSPLLPNLGTHFSLTLGSSSFGFLSSAYPLGMLFGMSLWPLLSDISYLGRKKVMMYSLFGSSLGLFLQSHAISSNWSLKTFLLLRVFTGSFAGSQPVAKAFLADIIESIRKNKAHRSQTISTPSNRSHDGELLFLSKVLARRDAASSLAYILGPAIGGTFFHTRSTYASMLSSSSLTQSHALAFVIAISAFASLLAATLVTIFVHDPYKDKMNASPEQRTTQPQQHNKETSCPEDTHAIHKDANQVTKARNTTTTDDNEDTASNHSSSLLPPKATHENHVANTSCPLGSSLWSGIITVCIVSFLFHIADSTFISFFPVLLRNKLEFDARAIGITFTFYACVSFLLSACSVPTLMIQRWSVVRTCVIGLSVIGTGLASLSLACKDVAPLKSSLLYSYVGNNNIFTTCILIAGMIYFCGVPLYSPTIPSILLQCVPPNQRGRVMGVDGAINTIARIASPILMGEVYRQKGASMAFGLSSLFAFASASLALIKRYFMVQKSQC